MVIDLVGHPLTEEVRHHVLRGQRRPQHVECGLDAGVGEQ
jgi:hypothetical protein